MKNVSIRQRATVALLLFASAILSFSLFFKDYAIVCYAIGFIMLISALVVAISNVRIEQRKTALILTLTMAVLGGVGTYLLAGF